VKPWNLIYHRRFGGIYCLHLQVRLVSHAISVGKTCVRSRAERTDSAHPEEGRIFESRDMREGGRTVAPMRLLGNLPLELLLSTKSLSSRISSSPEHLKQYRSQLINTSLSLPVRASYVSFVSMATVAHEPLITPPDTGAVNIRRPSLRIYFSIYTYGLYGLEVGLQVLVG
jgi:hypothetical protein